MLRLYAYEYEYRVRGGERRTRTVVAHDQTSALMELMRVTTGKPFESEEIEPCSIYMICKKPA